MTYVFKFKDTVSYETSLGMFYASKNNNKYLVGKRVWWIIMLCIISLYYGVFFTVWSVLCSMLILKSCLQIRRPLKLYVRYYFLGRVWGLNHWLSGEVIYLDDKGLLLICYIIMIHGSIIWFM